ncbi:MAG: hypothetical protein COU08_01270 [Candidatus Harrisonbacteria bacterium CG10_big_fil_rev_8_21_14_0_10_42_17]|uniref:Uncharacterized protein n=1 Tax=Candidatus Harrisonbacteria bacterium CG10_big_fil_rev_8_21_14_0_10_42_17 TaxID=1974584 RepID=A0A2M6WIL6_9BACT|nr:MAG: hypothetical protein COU08_01270 [Candidatus Harrisonbacteria bacterium CG10_big_fil_rev_8_21_14_0_10_42_17]
MNRESSIKNQEVSDNNKRGAVSLGTVIVLGTVILEIGVASAILVFLLTSGGYGGRLSQSAYAAAEAGMHDVLLRIARNKTFSCSGSDCGNLVVDFTNSASVDVLFMRDTPAFNQHTVIATGHAFSRNRRLEAILEVDDVTGIVHVLEIKETTVLP